MLTLVLSMKLKPDWIKASSEASKKRKKLDNMLLSQQVWCVSVKKTFFFPRITLRSVFHMSLNSGKPHQEWPIDQNESEDTTRTRPGGHQISRRTKASLDSAEVGVQDSTVRKIFKQWFRGRVQGEIPCRATRTQRNIQVIPCI